MKYFSFGIGLLLLASFAFGADIDGKWSGTITGMNMPIEFTFKAEGKTLTGFHIVSGTETAIKDGKIDGNNISFILPVNMQGNSMEIDYSGVVSGNEIELTLNVMGQAISYTVTKVE